MVGLSSNTYVVAQGLEYVKANYTKHEFKIPMRDGIKLFTAVYMPKDVSKSYPILFSRTPYSCAPYGVDQYRSDLGPSPLFGTDGYIFVYQDVRGRWMSEGDFVHMRPIVADKKSSQDIDESSDTYDTIDWLINTLEGHNGKVGLYGISYPGFYTSNGVIDAHPALVAAMPQAPISDWFVGDDFHHNGALFLPHMFNFLSYHGRERPQPTNKSGTRYDYGTPDGYQFYLNLGPLNLVNKDLLDDEVPFWDDVMKHGTYDEYWKARNLRPHLKNIKPAVMTVGGWFDAENLFGALETYKNIEANSPDARNTLVMGPWRHGQWARETGESLGYSQFNAKTAEFYREKIEFPFFKYHLKGDGDGTTPEAWVFETGTNQWRKYDQWPPAEAKPASIYLKSGSGLSTSAPKDNDGFDEFISDPNKPVPFIDWINPAMPAEYLVADQRFASRRTDVIVYQTEILERDITLVGEVEVDFYVSTTGTDSDWIVKIIDVYPDDYPDPSPNPTQVRMGGFQQLIRGDVMRGKFRNSYENPEPFEPGKPTRVKFTLPDTYHAFRTGHRLMVQIQSSWFPLVDRNPQKFMDIYAAEAGDFQSATQRVYRTADMPSRLNVRILK
ncbi:MAG: CocE/NonD family hydrolase [Planctomycetota bacterium]|nr:CocE/NonD family hydrolase [Planctomycetota bacterium]MDA1212031.1 CocE/NonD family hydrolase [Planctomycetota bacterium]